MKKLFFALLSLVLMATSCSKEDLLATEEANDASTNIKFSIKDFELVTDEPETRTVIENSVKNKVKASWVNGDEIGVFAIADYHVPQTIFPVSKATQRKDNEEGSMSLSFNGNGFYRLIDGQKYIAYYPFQDMMSSKSYDKIPVSFEGQKQTMSNSGSHLGKYDYLCSDVTVANSGMANFVFSHAICVAKFKIRLPENVKITNITLKNINGNKIFVEKGFLDVSTKTILPSSKSVELSMDVANVSKRNTFYSYIAFAPTTLEDYKVIVTAEDGTKYESSVMPKRVMESGKFYYAEVLMTKVNEAVDLGLSVKWAKMNVGATSPEDYGNYYVWGETEPKDVGHTYNDFYAKYNSNDNLRELENDDDAAYVNWGADWRMPTKSELEELVTGCYWEYTDNFNGAKGFIVYQAKNNTDKGYHAKKGKDKIEGYSIEENAYIFIPYSKHFYDSDGVFLWSKTIDDVYHPSRNYAYILYGGDNYLGIYCGNQYGNRIYALPVRPVLDKK